MAKTGRPRRNSVEMFAAAINSCIAEFELTGDAKALTDYELARRLNLSIDQLDNYYDGEPDRAIEKAAAQEQLNRIERESTGDSPAAGQGEQGTQSETPTETPTETQTKRTYSGELKRLVQYRSAACTSHIARGGQVTGWIFLSKQKRWGGYSDTQRAETLAKSEITVTLKGADGKTLL